MDTIKRKVRVTIEKEITVELPAEFGTEEYLNDFRKGLWHVDSVDDVAKYAARMAAYSENTRQEDGLGWLGGKGMTYPRVPEVTFIVHEDECDEEIVL